MNTASTSYSLNVPIADKAMVIKLVLTHQNLTEVPLEVLSFPNLITLDISSNNITTIPKVLDQLVYLNKINAANNQLTDFPLIPTLTSLILANNKFQKYLDVFFQMPLVGLDLSKNKITSIRPPKGIKNLAVQQLNLSHNQLTTIHGFIHHFTNLKGLNLNNNALQTIPKGIKNASLLESLSVTNNKLTKIPNAIKSFTQLRALDLSYNRIRIVPKIFSLLSTLHQINLEYNKIDVFPDFLGELPTLFQLDLNQNKIAQLNITSPFPALTNLDVNNNRITTFTAGSSTLKNLRNLSISHNKITSLPEQLTSKLSILAATNNKIKSFGNTNQQMLNNLEELNLSNNHLQQLNGTFPNLRFISLKYNPIKLSNLELIKKTPNLQIVDTYKKDKSKVLIFLTYCQRMGIQSEEERINLFQFSKKNIPNLTLQELYYAIHLGHKEQKMVYDYITKKWGYPLNGNCSKDKQLTLLTVGKTHFNHPVLLNKFKALDYSSVSSLDQKPSHILLGTKPRKQVFYTIINYAKNNKVSLFGEVSFYKKSLIDSAYFAELSGSSDLQNNLLQLLNSPEDHNQRLGLQMILSNGLPKTKKLKERILYLRHNYHFDSTENLAYDILVLNGIEPSM